jgi:hypothetical protein
MLNSVNYADTINLPDLSGSLDFVNPSDLIILRSSMDLPDFMQDLYLINGSYLIKGFDHLR